MRWDQNYKMPEVINDPAEIPSYHITDTERAYWNSKQDALEYDAEPTAFSDKHLISGAIYNALQQYKSSTIRVCQAYFNTETERLARAAEECEAALPAIRQAVIDTQSASSAAALSESNAAASETNAANSRTAAEAAAAEAAEYAQLLSLAWFTNVSGEIYINWEE